MQALARFGCESSKLLEADRRVDEVAQDQACRLWLPIEEQGGCLVKQRLRECRIALDPLDHCLLEIACQRPGLHLFLWPLPAFRAWALLRASYSANKVLA